jgi:hypothetical protein
MKKFNLDFKSIQDLKNENDAYYIDRYGNVGVLEFIGECDGSHYEGQRSRLYKKNGNLEYIVTHKDFKEIDFFGDDDSKFKENKLFSKLGETCHNYSYMFVPSREKLVWLFGIKNDKKVCYGVSQYIETYVKDVELCKPCTQIKYFDDKETAVKYYNEVKKEIYEKFKKSFKEVLISLDETKDKLKSLGINDSDLHSIKASKAKCGIKYHLRNLCEKILKRTIVIEYIDNDGVAHLTNKKVLPPDTTLYSEENYKQWELREKHSDLIEHMYTIQTTVDSLKREIEKMEKQIEPFSNKSTFIDIRILDYLK